MRCIEPAGQVMMMCPPKVRLFGVTSVPVPIGSLIYNAPLEYADLILNGDSETYLKTVTEYKPLDS